MQVRCIVICEQMLHMTPCLRQVANVLAGLRQIVFIVKVAGLDLIRGLQQRSGLGIPALAQIELAQPVVGFKIPRRAAESRAQFFFRGSRDSCLCRSRLSFRVRQNRA